MPEAKTLDVTELPVDLLIGGVRLGGRVAQLLKVSMPHWERSRIITPSDSFGMAFANPSLAEGNPSSQYHLASDDPKRLVGLVHGWGPRVNQRIADAVRMMRPAARTSYDTSDICRSVRSSLQFANTVDSVEPDGSFAWGDIPQAGAVYVPFHGRRYLCSVSGLPPEQNHWVAMMIGAYLATELTGLIN